MVGGGAKLRGAVRFQRPLAAAGAWVAGFAVAMLLVLLWAGDAEAQSANMVVVGQQSLIASTIDGNTFSQVQPAPALIHRDVAYGNGKWVVVGDGSRVLVSADGFAWTAAAGPPTGGVSLRAVEYGRDSSGEPLWVTVGPAGGIWTASDPAGSWNKVLPAPSSDTYNEVAYHPADHAWVVRTDATAVGSRMVRSTDGGVTWSLGSMPAEGVYPCGIAVDFQGRWVSVGNAARKVAYAQGSAAAWTAVATAKFPMDQPLYDVQADHLGNWVAVGETGISTNTAAGIDSDASWTVASHPASHTMTPQYRGVGYAPDIGSTGMWLGVGLGGKAARSDDGGTTWVAVSIGTTINLYAAAGMPRGVPDLAKSEIEASPDSILADGISTSKITLTLRDAAGTQVKALPGQTVSIASSAGTLVGSVADHGNGSYTQTLNSAASTTTIVANVTATLSGSDLADWVNVTFSRPDIAPHLVTNTGIIVQEAHPGSTPTPIMTAHLAFDDANDGSHAPVANITAVPARGSLMLRGAPAEIGDPFGMGDLEAGDLTYQATADEPDATQPQDRFSFTLHDPDNPQALAYQDGEEQTFEITVTPFDDAPAASFLVGSSPHFAGISVDFHDTSASGDEPITGWEWDFGEGWQAGGPEIHYTFPTPGSYDVRLRITEGTQTDIATTSLTVGEYIASHASFGASHSRVQVGEPVTFTDTSRAGTVPFVHRNWDVKDATPPSTRLDEPVLTHTFTAPGTYLVALTLLDEIGQRYFVSHVIEVVPVPDSEPSPVQPVARLTSSARRPLAEAGADIVAAPGAVVLLDGSASVGQPPLRHAWRQVHGSIVTFRDTTSGNPTVVLPYVMDPLELTFELRVYDASGSSLADQVRVVVLPGAVPGPREVPPPRAAFVPEDLGSGRFRFAAVQAAGVTYAWEFGDGAEALGPAVEHTYGVAGSYAVRLVVQDAYGRTDSQTRTVELAVADVAHDTRQDASRSSTIAVAAALVAVLVSLALFLAYHVVQGRRPAA